MTRARCAALLSALACAAGAGLGPFCTKHSATGHLACRSKRWLCGCADGSCERDGTIDRAALQALDLRDGVARMATFKAEIPVPECLCPGGEPGLLDPAGWLAWALGGGVEVRQRPGQAGCTPCIPVPSHAWNEIELPRSNCYLMLGGQSSAMRDRADSAFRLLLHDTTFRWWSRERDKLVYDGLLLHRPAKLSAGQIELLTHLIKHGSQSEHPLDDPMFERPTDQDQDLGPVYLELPPKRYLFQDDAVPGMLAAYTGLFSVYEALKRLIGTLPVLNCVVLALLFGKSPHTLLGMVPQRPHQAVRWEADRLNSLWAERFEPILSSAAGVFQPTEKLPVAPRVWWLGWLDWFDWLDWLLPPPLPAVRRLSLQEQLERHKHEYVQLVLRPLRAAMVDYDPALAVGWDQAFGRLEAAGERDPLARCVNGSAVEQLLLCDDWRETSYWQRKMKATKNGRPAALNAGAVLKETNIAVRRALYWGAADRAVAAIRNSTRAPIGDL